jgi:hypothetical protein
MRNFTPYHYHHKNTKGAGFRLPAPFMIRFFSLAED